MSETLFLFIPDYGLHIIFVVVMAGCLALPLPASIVVLASGGLVAAGDLVWWHVLVVAAGGFIIGDQIAFALAKRIGGSLLGWLRGKRRTAPLVQKSETLLDQRGQTAVFLSHTLFSPTCAYISYLCGAGGMNWARFTAAAVPGAVVWTMAYLSLGFVFASQLTQVAKILSDFFGIALAAAVITVCFRVLRARWRKMQRDTADYSATGGASDVR